MYVSSNINYSTTKSFEIENDGCENISTNIQNDAKLPLIVGAVYRHPNSNANEFTKSFDVSLSKINQQHAKCVVLGDFNIDLMDNSPRPHVKNNYINMLNSNAFHVLLDKPTRITPDSQTLIDHVISNYIRPDSTAGILNYEITDHLPIFLALTSSPVSKEPSDALYRSFKNFNENAYVNDLHSTLENWFLFTPDLNESNFNIVFRDFVKSVQLVIDNHAPLKPYSRKQQRLRSKPWISKAIYTSIKWKQKLHRTHYLQGTSVDRLHYKKFANLLTNIKKAAKALHYERLLKKNNNSTHIWNALRELLPNKKAASTLPLLMQDGDQIATAHKQSAELFNNFFVNIGNALTNNIKSASTPTSFLKNRVPSSFVMFSPTPVEISQEITRLKIKKSTSYDEILRFFSKQLQTLLPHISLY